MAETRWRSAWLAVPVALGAMGEARAYEPWPENVVSWPAPVVPRPNGMPGKTAIDPDPACYDKVYVPATVQINTRGRLVSPERFSWEQGELQWQRVRHPAVYIQTRKVIEQDHYTLVRAACREAGSAGWDIQDRTR